LIIICRASANKVSDSASLSPRWLRNREHSRETLRDETIAVDDRPAVVFCLNERFTTEGDLAKRRYAGLDDYAGLHDVPPDVAAAGEPHQRPEADAVFGSVCDFGSWPSIPIRAVAGADDRFFPVGFQQGLARDRLGVEADVLPGGHLIAVSRPGPLARYLLAV
jgi:hypothetical protein